MNDRPVIANLDALLAQEVPERPARGPAVADLDVIFTKPDQVPTREPEDPAARRKRLEQEILEALARHSTK